MDQTSVSKSTSKQPTVAAAPFDKPNADLIIRSSDLVDFRVRKAILEEASHVFEDMLSLPQPEQGKTHESITYNGADVPVISLAEDSATLRPLLLLCYRVATPTIDIGESLAITQAAKKYMMDGPFSRMIDMLGSWVAEDPCRVYVIASICESKKLMERAAFIYHRRADKSHVPDCPEFDIASARVLRNLINYYYQAPL